MRMLLIALCATMGLAQAPATLSGSIDGQPLPPRFATVQQSAIIGFSVTHQHPPTSAPADQQEIAATVQSLTCGYLKTAIAAAGVDRAKADLGVSARPQDLAAAKQQFDYLRPDFQKQWAQGLERTQALIAGLIAVYDQAQDPLQVYPQMIAPHHIDRTEWLQQVYTHQTKAQRDNLAKQLNRTPADYIKAYDDPARLKTVAEGIRLTAMLDQHLSAADPTFAAYWQEYEGTATHDSPVSTGYITTHIDHVKYLENSRYNWWKAENMKVQVNLSDTTLTSRCTGLTDPPPPIHSDTH